MSRKDSGQKNTTGDDNAVENGHSVTENTSKIDPRPSGSTSSQRDGDVEDDSKIRRKECDAPKIEENLLIDEDGNKVSFRHTASASTKRNGSAVSSQINRGRKDIKRGKTLYVPSLYIDNRKSRISKNREGQVEELGFDLDDESDNSHDENFIPKNERKLTKTLSMGIAVSCYVQEKYLFIKRNSCLLVPQRRNDSVY